MSELVYHHTVTYALVFDVFTGCSTKGSPEATVYIDTVTGLCVVSLQNWWASFFAVVSFEALDMPSDEVVLCEPRCTATNALLVLRIRSFRVFNVVTSMSWSPCARLTVGHCV